MEIVSTNVRLFFQKIVPDSMFLAIAIVSKASIK